MRTRFGLPLAAVCLALIGCATPGPKPNPADGPDAPFTGAKLTKPVRDASTPPPEADVLLAGQVVEKAFGKRVANASIQVIDLEDPAPSARLDVSANADGYFFIPGLQRGHHYQLIGRIKDGDHLLSGMTLSTPPNPRLSIYISEDLTSPSTPAPPAPPLPPAAPAKPPSDKDAPTPPAALAPPKAGPDPGASAPASPPFNKIADGPAPEPGGFQSVRPPPTVTIPNGSPNPVLPPPPPFAPSTPPMDAPPPPVDQARHDGPPARSAPPFCVLVGNRLDNFSLPTLAGGSWEFRRDPPRKLVLLDFWKSNCGPCREAIPHLTRLQEAYGRDGLEVVGIAYEDEAPPAQQAVHVREAASRYHINYTILMGADSRAGGPCPVRSQFLVDRFPRLVLIDETGDILWRSSPEGLSDDEFSALQRQIEQKLYKSGR